MKCEICKELEYQHKHHIISKSLGGSNKPDNIAYVCAYCHHNIHKGIIIVEGRFVCLPSGNILIWHKKNEESITEMEDSNVYIN